MNEIYKRMPVLCRNMSWDKLRMRSCMKTKLLRMGHSLPKSVFVCNSFHIKFKNLQDTLITLIIFNPYPFILERAKYIKRTEIIKS